MATEVSKYSVYDPRVIQQKPKYAVEKGALSVNNVTFNAQTANSSSQQFNVIVPSENVFIDRAVDWVSGGVVSVSLGMAGTGAASGNVLVTPGEVALAAFPCHQTVQQMTATINDASVSVNTADVLNQVLRLSDLSLHRKQRTCPTMLDTYASYPRATSVGGVDTATSQASLQQGSPLATYGARFESDQLPNGAFSQWWFCDVNGAPLTTNNGLPVSTGTGTVAEVFYIRFQSTEKLLLPPFIFGDGFEMSTGLFGVQNFQVQMNLASSPARAIRIADTYVGRAVGTARTVASFSVAWTTSTALTYAPYPIAPALAVQFLTPALDVPLPPKSIVPYMEFPRYITNLTPNQASTIGASIPTAQGGRSGATAQSSNTITLPNIPDLIMIYAKPSTVGATIGSAALYTGQSPTGIWDSAMSDFTLPISAISVNFDNFSGLLANHSQYELYKMSVNNGLDMDFATWSGESKRAPASGTGTPYVATCGGPLVLRPGRDFALQAGQAPGLVGNFSLQFNVTLGNQWLVPITSISLFCVPISSGFFETIKGSSRIIKGVLTEQDILSSANAAPAADLDRLVGRANTGDMGKSYESVGRKKDAKGSMGAYM